jgi:type VI secretion system protein ImpH
VKLADETGSEPWRFDFFSVLRVLERSHPDKPRIGDSAARREEYVLLGQDPYMEFPASNLGRFERAADGKFRVVAKFLGLLGPQGALPLATTEEAYNWNLARDDSFPRFLDIFNHRFLQLFFRAWADARPVAQHDRPEADRFVTYVGAHVGLGSALYRGLDSVPDEAKLAFAGLLAPQAKSASRLRSFLSGVFDADVEVDEFVGARLVFEEADRTRLGRNNSALSRDLLVGASVFSVQDKFRIRIFVKTMAEYVSYLPNGTRCGPLADLVFFYVGDQFEWEVELAIPAGETAPLRLSRFGQLGWTSWMSPNWSEQDRRYRCDARFHPQEIRKQRRRRAP